MSPRATQPCRLVLGGALAEIPDVAIRVLGIPVARDLNRIAALGDDVPNDARLDAVRNPTSFCR